MKQRRAKKWLEMYSRENDVPEFTQGRHYEFSMYGGAILDSLCLMKQGANEKHERKKLVEMFSFSRNAYIVMDSDAVKSDNGKIRDASSYFKAKRFVRCQVEALQADGRKLGLWYAENDTQLRTIEDYLDAESLASGSASLSKKVRAEKIVANWGERKHLAAFHINLSVEMGKLYEIVKSWQE